MRTSLIIFMCCILQGNIQAQQDIKVISMMQEKVTQMIFPANIKSFKGGFIPDDFIMDKQENVLYIQPLGSFEESNLNVVTEDNLYYTFTIRYNLGVKKFNHIIKKSEAIFGYEKEEENGREINNSSLSPESEENVCRRLVSLPDGLMKRNAVRYKTTYMYVKGIYVHKDRMYFRISFENKSNIPYDFEYIAFYIREKKQKKNSTQERVQLLPEYAYNEAKQITPNGTLEIVYSFPKFTIGKEKALFVDLIEKEGERNLSLEIDNSMILEAKKIN